MLPLNYAILKLFLNEEEADVDVVMDLLRGQYHNSRQFRRKSVNEALMTAEANGLLEEAYTGFDDQQNLRIFYRVSSYGRAMIFRYIGD